MTTTKLNYYNELNAIKSFVKERSKAGENVHLLYQIIKDTSSTYEFMINGKNYISFNMEVFVESCLYKRIVITQNQYCKVLNTL